MSEKKKIVEEAFTPGATIKGTARKYGVCASQIRGWKRKLIKILRSDELTDEQKLHLMGLKRLAPVKPMKDLKDIDKLEEIKQMFDKEGKKVTASILAEELMKVSKDFNNLSRNQVVQKVYRWIQNRRQNSSIQKPSPTNNGTLDLKPIDITKEELTTSTSGSRNRKRNIDDASSHVLFDNNITSPSMDDLDDPSISALFPDLSHISSQNKKLRLDTFKPDVSPLDVANDVTKLLTLNLLEEEKPKPIKVEKLDFMPDVTRANADKHPPRVNTARDDTAYLNKLMDKMINMIGVNARMNLYFKGVWQD